MQGEPKGKREVEVDETRNAAPYDLQDGRHYQLALPKDPWGTVRSTQSVAPPVPTRTLYIDVIWHADCSYWSSIGDTAKELMEEYDLAYDVNAPRERNVNRFIQFVGVGYQLVRSRRTS